jgi:ribosomal protein S18 acetylase RimI-like enzyme
MIIRSATVADLSRLIVLFQQEIAYQRQIEPFFDVSSSFDWRHFAEVKLSNPNEQILVAERDGQLLGYIDVRALLPTQSRPPRNIMRRLIRRETPAAFVRPYTVGRIEDCYVETQFQRQGIGSALVREGLTWLKAKGVTRIELAVSVANSKGKSFWERQGFFAFRLLMSKEAGLSNMEHCK